MRGKGALFFCVLLPSVLPAQNTPSLLYNRNINATFSIIAYDKTNSEWGIAVATDNICVGNSTVYIQPGLGAFSVIAETEPAYAINGFQQLKEGKTIEQAIQFTHEKDTEYYNRQVAGIDATGNAYAFTGEALKHWNGTALHIAGNGYIVLGNQLANGVLKEMAATFEQAKGTLAERLLKSLLAGQQAGGQLSGKQSAALVVKGTNSDWFNQVDLRVDNSKTPFDELQTLLNYHYGRIKINQAINAIGMMDRQRSEALLQQSVALTAGWNGIYDKIAKAYIMLGNEQQAVQVIKKALAENIQWKERLPAFYCLAKYKEMNGLPDTVSFSLKDWNAAISFMIGLGRNHESIKLAGRVLQKYPSSAVICYLLGKAYKQAGDKKQAIASLTAAIKLEHDYAEAKIMLQELEKE